ncbi:MAG: hypothetical protein ABI488_11470 [Polyangiaceae bacterium]
MKDWSKERWRKLYLREALEQRVWSVMTRGLRDYLIRVAEDDGALIRDSADPVAALVAALGAHAEEAALVRAAIELLLCDGFLTGNARSLFVGRLPEAQSWERPTPAAAASAETDTRTAQTTTTVSTERVRRFRERQREAASANRVETVAPGETLDSVSSAPETVSPSVSCNVPASRGDRNTKHSGNFLDLQKQKHLDLLPPETRATPVSRNGPASVSPVSVSPARRAEEEEDDDENSKVRGEERDGDDITARAKRLKSNPELAATLRPERWPEVLSVAQAFASAAGIPKQPLGQYDGDAGVKALVTLYAAGFTQFELEHVARTVPNQPWWLASGKKLGMSSLSIEVARRNLPSGSVAQRLSPTVAKALAFAERHREAG